MSISTHILDTSRGKPAAGVAVTLEQLRANEWHAVGSGATDADGRARSLLAAGASLTRGTYRLKFEVATYFAGLGVSSFYPSVEIAFTVADPTEHYHVPLLLSPFGYSTYRGT